MEQSSPRILIILTGSLGDIARGLFLLPRLRAESPDCHITWLVEDKWQSFVRLHPYIDEVLVFHRKKGVKSAFELVRDLRARHFDLALDLQRNLKSGVISLLSSAPRRVGFHPSNAKEYNWLFQNEYISSYAKDAPKFLQYCEFARALAPDHLQDTTDEVHDTRADFQQSGIEQVDFSELIPVELKLKAPIGIVLGSSRANKNWPEPHYQALVATLRQRYPDQVLLLLGDGSQAELSERILAKHADNGGMLVSAIGRTSLPELVAVLQSCRLVIGPDSGPAHISAALGIPYLGLYGSSNPARVAPPSPSHIVLRADLACAPCEKRKCCGLGVLCMDLLRPNQVLEQVAVLIAETSTAH